MGTNNFTAECWIYPTASPNQPLIFGQWSNPYAWAIQLSNNSSRYLRFLLHIGGYVDTISTNTRVPLNEWSHLALVRNGSTFTLYFNGVSALTVTNSGSITDASSALTIGGQSSGGQPFQGYIRDARFVVGDAVYTANFTPPNSQLISTGSNTKLLACHAPYIGDGSSESRTITVGGGTHTQRFGPYDVNSYSTSSNGASVYFDGSGDYLSLSDDASLQMGSGDFTIEAWVYVNAHKNYNYIYSYSFPYQFTIDSNGNLESYFNDGDNSTSYITVQGSTAIPTSTWTHVAVVRNGNTLTQFVNGAQDGTTTSSATLATPSTYDPRIGDWGAGSYSFNGYISDLRIVKGHVVYTGNFTPPTGPTEPSISIVPVPAILFPAVISFSVSKL